MKSIFEMSVGDHFAVHGYEHELVFIGPNELRAARIAGGNVFTLSKDKFLSLQRDGQIKIIKQQKTEKPNPSNLTENQIKEMNRRLRYIRYVFNETDSCRSATIVEPILAVYSNTINDKNPPAFSTFARWAKSYVESKYDPVSLAPNFSRRGIMPLKFDPEIEQIVNQRIKEDYLTDQQVTMKHVHENIVSQILSEYGDSNSIPSGLSIPSLSTIERRIAKIDPYIRTKTRRGKYAAKKAFKAAGRSIYTERILESVQADGSLLDVLVVDPDTGEVVGRPYATILIDHYSRCVISAVITMDPFSAATILQAMKLAVSSSYSTFGGLFEKLCVDNGSDYTSKSLKNFCNHLGIMIEFGSPRDPDSKPNVERFFGRVNCQFLHTLRGTTFESPTKRGDYKSEKYACFTLDELKNKFKEWLDIYYHKTLHRGHGRTPEALWDESKKKTPIVQYDYKDIDQIARNVYTRTINGGRIKAFNLSWFSHALKTIEHKFRNKNKNPMVHVYVDTLNLDRVFIRDPDDDGVFIQADSTTPKYTRNLSLFEHNKIQEKLKSRGKKDLAKLDQYALAIARWKFRQDLIVMGDKYAAKQIARLKESAKNQEQDNSIIKEHEDNSISPELFITEFKTHDESFIEPNTDDDDDDEQYEAVEF
ncbi:DDE-type integrase/transposase/recombinase [Marinicella meishanensis]|uniref:DDE-type integrase/transposase/recombinase n=1 Tax=Marinicella meishanensis TaxID=2873263 RepID=UPI001CBCC47A|nr:DDE-type integrase/transposase/recombinase [Marinicella sp. NBU2979]